MKDKLRESVSALIDDAADELEVRRVLAQSHDDDVLKSWEHYHQLKSSLKPDEARWIGIDLRQGINAAIDESLAEAEPHSASEAVELVSSEEKTASAHQQNSAPESIVSGKRWWSGLALAASVAFAVVFAVQFGNPDQHSSNGPIVADSKDVSDVPSVAESVPVAIEFTKEHETRLNEYIMQHAGHAALNTGKSILPFARLTSFEPADGQAQSQQERALSEDGPANRGNAIDIDEAVGKDKVLQESAR